MKKFVVLLVVVVLVLGLVPATSIAQDDKPFKGMKVVVVTQEGRSIGGPVEDYKAQWEEQTGGEVELQQFAFGDLFEKIITAFEPGSGAYVHARSRGVEQQREGGGFQHVPLPESPVLARTHQVHDPAPLTDHHHETAGGLLESLGETDPGKSRVVHCEVRHRAAFHVEPS